MQHTSRTTRQSLRRFALVVALLLGSFTALAGLSSATASTLIPFVDAGGPGGGGAASAPAPYAGSANERSVTLVESKESDQVTVVHMSPNDRSIALIEGEDPANGNYEFVVAPVTTTEAIAVSGVGDSQVNFCIACDGLY